MEVWRSMNMKQLFAFALLAGLAFPSSAIVIENITIDPLASVFQPAGVLDVVEDQIFSLGAFDEGDLDANGITSVGIGDFNLSFDLDGVGFSLQPAAIGQFSLGGYTVEILGFELAGSEAFIAAGIAELTDSITVIGDGINDTFGLYASVVDVPA